LMLDRCTQIRNRYDHVSLMYSGGYDSHTILKTFVDNNIRLDTILLFQKEYYDNSYDWRPSLNYAKLVKKYKQPWLEIKIVALKANQILDIYNRYKEHWIYKSNKFCAGKSQTWYLLEHQSLIFNQINKKNGIILWGQEKPMLDFHDGCYYARLHDDQVYQYLNTKNGEPFYLSYNFPELYVKQCWMAVNFYESLDAVNNQIIHQNQGGTNIGLSYRKYNLALGRECLQHDMALYKYYTVDWKNNMILDETNRKFTKESIELNRYFNKHDIIIKKYHEGALDYIGSKFGVLPTILSKAYKMKVCQKYKK
jgi:hypothetical protein